MMKEILTQRGFSEEEISTLETQEDYETLRLKVERYQADMLLDQLQVRAEDRVEATTETLESRWSAFKTDILALESSDSLTDITSTETLEQMQTRLREEAIGKAEEEIRSRVSSVPLLGESIADWLINSGKEYINNNDESFGGKVKNWIFILIAGVFGVNNVFDDLKSEVTIAAEADISLPETENITPQPSDIETGVENLNVDNFRYNSGLETIIFFSDGENIEGNNFIRNKIYDRIKDLPLSEVRQLDGNIGQQERVFGEDNMQLDGFQEGLSIILNSIQDEAFLDVCELSLSGRISDILMPHGEENTTLFVLLGSQAGKIFTKSQEIGFDLQSLTMYELSILYTASFPNFAYLQLSGGLSAGISTINTTSESFIDMAQNSLAGRVASFETSVGSGGLIDNNSEFRSGMQERYPDMSLNTIEDIIAFKDKIKSFDFQNHPSLKMTPEMQAAFDGNLTYTKIMILHDIMGGGNIEDINTLNFPLLILSVGSIIGGRVGDNLENSRLESQYKSQFLRDSGINFFLSNNLTETERRAIEIYGENFAQLWMISAVESIYSTAGIADSIIGSIPEEQGLIGSSLTVLAGRQVLKSGFTRGSLMRIGGGKLAMRAGWVGVLIYGVILGRDILADDSSEDLEELPTNEDGRYIGQVLERDLEAATNIEQQQIVINRLEENVRTHNIGGETMTVITYPGDVPHAVYKGQIWTFDVLDTNNVAGSIEGHLIDFLHGLEQDKNEQTSLDRDSVWSDGENIYVGETAQSSFQFTFEQLFSDNQMSMGIETARNGTGALREFLDTEFPGHGFQGEGDLGQYITLLPLPGESSKYITLIAAPTSNGIETPVS